MRNKKRFEFNSFNQDIYDNLTGKRYHTLSKITRLLNQESDRADKNAERFDDYLEYEHIAKRVQNIMYKYQVVDLDELDKIVKIAMIL